MVQATGGSVGMAGQLGGRSGGGRMHRPEKLKTASGMDSKTFSKIVVLALMIDQLDVDIYMTPHFSINSLCYSKKVFSQ